MVEMTAVLDRPSDAQVQAWLETVPDPEIPVVSLVDLGIVRGFAWEDDTLVVTVTPTYSGCPATAVIAIDVETTLLDKGVEKVRIESQLSPAWTTDWISEDGRRKLHDYGIVPPVDGSACVGALKMTGAAAADIACPRCASKAVERISQFGSTPCKASYRCTDCLEPFDYFKSI